MKFFKAYLVGWLAAFRNWKLCLLLYLLNFLVAFLSLIPLSGFLNQTVGQSLSLNRSLDRFDYLFLSDFYNEYGEGLFIILNQSIVILLLSFLSAIFLMGGILWVIKNSDKAFKFNEFWKACADYFWCMLRLTFYFLLFHGALLALFFILFLANGISPFELESEEAMVHYLRFVFPIYLFFATLLFMVQDYAKVHIIYQNKKFITWSILESFKFVFKNIFTFLALYLLNIATFLLLFCSYYYIQQKVQVNDMTSITIMFLLGQVFILGRIMVKFLNLASANYLYQSAFSSKGSVEEKN